jgi:L-ascorbate metabolism protein UlaG (beta-lactamase superfamily)
MQMAWHGLIVAIARIACTALACSMVLAVPARSAQLVSRCLAVSEGPRLDRGIQRVAIGPALASTEILLESSAGVRVVTDYNDYVTTSVLPDVATMNRAHSSHYTDNPDPRIAHVLRGWNPGGGAARHAVEVRDVHIRNVPTNIRDWGSNSTISYGNSIFIFEVAGLCVGHLGHLHHTLTPEQLAAIGQLDVVLVPVDGGYTMDIGGMVEVVRTLRARLIIPMHYFNQFTLARFVDRMKAEFPIETASSSEILISQRLLPAEPKILVLPGQ